MQNNLEPDTTMEADVDRAIANRPMDIPGWGVDADSENDPSYPMKRWNGADHERFNYEKPPQQQVESEIFHSSERPGISRVFGTSTPPKGLTGRIRRFAFQYSESTYKHWVPLIVADRIDVINGIIDDLKRGIVPNIFLEKGWKSEWKYNRKGLMLKIAVTAAITAGIIVLLSRRKRRAGM